MIPSPNHSPRGGEQVKYVVIHTAEGARDVESLGNYFSRTSVQASSHVGIDDHRIESYVDYGNAAWTIRSCNVMSDNAELCGFAAWTRDQWLTEHRGMLELAAQWIRERCHARGIPIIKCTPADVAAGRPGVIGHVDWTIGARDGSHVDPGSGFPFDVVIQLARGGAPAPTPPETPMTPEDRKYFDQRFADVWARLGEINEGARSVLFGRPGVRSPGDLALAVDESRQRLIGIDNKVDSIMSRLVSGPPKLEASDTTQVPPV